MADDFNRKLQEWELMKEGGAAAAAKGQRYVRFYLLMFESGIRTSLALTISYNDQAAPKKWSKVTQK